MTSSKEPIGRRGFVLRILSVTALGLAFELLSRANSPSYAIFRSHHLSVMLQATAFCLVGGYSANVINRRLLDSGLSSWYRFPAYAIWLLSTSLPFVRTREWPIAAALFLTLVLAGYVIQGKHMAEKSSPAGKNAEDGKHALRPQSSIPPRLLIGPIGFLRSLWTFACISVPLIWFESEFGRGGGSLIMHLGFGVLYFVWVFKVFGRFADSGHQSSWFWFPFCIVVTIASALLIWFRLLNRYETLAFFLLIQIPLVFLRSTSKSTKPVRPPSAGDKYRERIALRKEVKPLVVGPFAFLRSLAVIACLWAWLVFMAGSGNPTFVWIARGGYFILTCAWIMNLTGRLEDAGWAHSWYPSQYFLTVSVVSLMPLALRWVNGYESLAIFVLVQLPMVFLKSKPRPKESVPEDAFASLP